MSGGRPTKLDDALIERAIGYVNSYNLDVETGLPTIEGLAYYLNIRRDTLYEWEKENEAFSDILENIRQLQANKLIQNSIVNKYNPTIAKMMLSKYGYVEKTEVDQHHTGEVQFTNDVPRPSKSA